MITIITYEVSLSNISIDIEKLIYFKVEFLSNKNNNNFAYLIHKIYNYKYNNNIPDDILKIEPDGNTGFYIINNLKISNSNSNELFNVIINYINDNIQYISSITLEPNIINNSNNYKDFKDIINFIKDNSYLRYYFIELSKIHMAVVINNINCPK